MTDSPRLITERDRLGRFFETDEPEPCGPHCACWSPSDFRPYGWCKKDDPEVSSAIAAGEYSTWKDLYIEENWDEAEDARYYPQVVEGLGNDGFHGRKNHTAGSNISKKSS